MPCGRCLVVPHVLFQAFSLALGPTKVKTLSLYVDIVNKNLHWGHDATRGREGGKRERDRDQEGRERECIK